MNQQGNNPSSNLNHSNAVPQKGNDNPTETKPKSKKFNNLQENSEKIFNELGVN